MHWWPPNQARGLPGANGSPMALYKVEGIIILLARDLALQGLKAVKVAKD